MFYIDVIIIVAYILFISWKGFTASTHQHSADDFFLANRSLTWPVIGLSLFATNISSSSLIGLSSSGYKTGISVFNYEWTGAVMMVIFAVFIIPYYLDNKLTTMPEYLERRFDSRSKYYFSVISISANIVIDISAALYAGSIFLKGIFPGVEIYFFIIIMAIISGLYTVVGGLKAVVVTDSIQTALMILGTLIVSVILFQNVGSWNTITESIDYSYLSLVRPVDDPTIPWPTLFISLPILGFYFLCTNQHMVQRVLGARSVDDGRKGAIFAGFLKLTLLFLIVLPGTLSQLIYPNLENSNLVFPKLVLDLLPTGLTGIVLMGFIAALMSSIDSALTAASTIATMDIYRKFKPESTDRQLIFTGRIFIIVFVIFASIWAPFIERFPTLWEYLQAALAYLIPPVVTCFLFGLFWRKASSEGAFYSLFLGNIFAFLLILNNYGLGFWGEIHYLYSATIIFIFSCLVMIGMSLLRPDQEKPERIPHPNFLKKKLKIAKGTVNQTKNWYQNYKLFSILLFITIFSLVYTFW